MWMMRIVCLLFRNQHTKLHRNLLTLLEKFFSSLVCVIVEIKWLLPIKLQVNLKPFFCFKTKTSVNRALYAFFLDYLWKAMNLTEQLKGWESTGSTRSQHFSKGCYACFVLTFQIITFFPIVQMLISLFVTPGFIESPSKLILWWLCYTRRFYKNTWGCNSHPETGNWGKYELSNLIIISDTKICCLPIMW